MTRPPAWDDLLLQSEELVRQQQEQGHPLRVERDVGQLLQFSQQLRARAARADALSTQLDADRLLAQEGLNPVMLRKTVQLYEVKPRPAGATGLLPSAGVGEFVDGVGRALALAGVQTARRWNTAAFEDYVDSRMNASWQQDKEALFEWSAPFSLPALPAPTAPNASPAAPGTVPPTTPAGLGAPLTGRAARYAQVACRLNRARLAGEDFDVAGEFGVACAGEADDVGRGATMTGMWKLLALLFGSLRSRRHVTTTARSDAMVAAARRLLEREFEEHVQEVVRQNRNRAALGASASRLALINAYVRVKLGAREGLDFDLPGGQDTTWIRIWLCLRAGFHAEAMQVASAARELAGARSTAAALPAALKEYIDSGCRPLMGNSGVMAEAERLLRERGGGGGAPWRLACHALLSGSAAAADAVGTGVAGVIPTIEDFLWLRLGLVVAAGGAGGPPTAAVAAGDAGRLRDLQQYLAQYPASHYTGGGREPLRYVRVLVLSQQWDAAAEFMARDPAATSLRLDAVYFAVALFAAGVLRPAGGSEGGAEGGGADADIGAKAMDGAAPPGPEDGAEAAAALVRRYARSLVPVDPELALEHYVLAAEAVGGSLRTRASLLRELLLESRAFGRLLARGGGLEQLFPDPAQRRSVLEAVAADAAARGATSEAVELYAFCDAPAPALELVAGQLSDAAAAGAPDDELAALGARGDALVAAMVAGGGDDGVPGGPSFSGQDVTGGAAETWDEVKAVAEVLRGGAARDAGHVLSRLPALPWLPTEAFRVSACVARAEALPPSLAARLPAVTRAAADALAAAGRGPELRAIAAFAGALGSRFSQADFRHLASLTSALT